MSRKHLIEAPAGLLVYRFNDAIFFENAGYFYKRITRAMKKAKHPVNALVLDASAISDIDYTAAKEIERLIGQLNADDIQFGVAHVSPRLKSLLKRYGLKDLIGSDNLFPSVRIAIEAYTGRHITNLDRIRALNLSPKDYVVIGGAVLELLGIRETNDVDIVVSNAAYKRLADKHQWKEFVWDDGKRILSRNGYKIMHHWMGRKLRDLQKTAIVVDDIPLMGLDDLVECKSQLGRQKDIKDIKKIKEFKTSIQKEGNLHLHPAFARAYYK